MSDSRHKNKNWKLPTAENGKIETWDAVKTAVLMDIRDELQELNRVFRCENFLAMPRNLNKLRSAVEGLRRDQRKK